MSLTDPPRFFRASAGIGLKPVGSAPQIDRTGGRFGAGLVRGVSVITRGEAVGHDLWIDQDFLSDTAGYINASPNGLKARFTHPGLSNDGVGSKLGALHGARVDGDQVHADLHLQHAATMTPDGNLAAYVMTLAEETPESFGLSVVFAHDRARENEHQADNTDGDRYISPDEGNSSNLPHAKLNELRSGDIVDEPAANPDGLFKRGQEQAQAAESLLSYAFGLTDVRPNTSSLAVSGERAAQFVERFLRRHDLTITKESDHMSTGTIEAPELTRADYSDELLRYTEAFGPENGSAWFAAELSYETAQSRHIDEMEKQLAQFRTEIAKLTETLSGISRGEEDAGEFSEQADAAPPRTFRNRIKLNGTK